MNVRAGTNITVDEANYDLGAVSEDKIESFDGESGKVYAEVEFDEGQNLDEAIEMYGKDTVFELYSRQAKRDLGNSIRSALNSGSAPEGVEARLEDWRPDVTNRGGSSSKSMEEQFSEMSPEEQEQKLQQLAQLAQQGNA